MKNGVGASSETQGQIAGARESLNGRKNLARRKVQNGEKSPWGQCPTRPVLNGRRRSAFWLVPENFCVLLLFFLNSVQKRVQTLYISEYKSPPPPTGEGNHCPGTGFWIPCQWNVDCGLWIPIARRNSLSWILDSKAQDSGFQSLQAKNFQDSGNPDITFHGAKWDLSTFKLNLVYVVQLIFYLRKFILYWLIFVFGYGNVR